MTAILVTVLVVVLLLVVAANAERLEGYLSSQAWADVVGTDE